MTEQTTDTAQAASTCPNAEELAGLLEVRPVTDETTAVENHVSACPTCTAQVELLAETVATLRGLGDLAMPPDVSQRLLTTLAEESSRRPRLAGSGNVVRLDSARRRRFGDLGIAASVGVLAAASVMIAQFFGTESAVPAPHPTDVYAVSGALRPHGLQPGLAAESLVPGSLIPGLGTSGYPPRPIPLG